MENPSRRKFLIGSASATLAAYFGNARLAQAQTYNLGAFWRQAGKVVKIDTSQVILKAVVRDTEYKILTTQAVTKAVVRDTEYKILTTQAVAKAVVRDTEYKIHSTQLVVKVALR